ncbi:MAG TPA: DUF4870 domain-containing protein, partial [Terriglobales bacterium]|nr:DUF4870 domain-containing protein [Terriglobales bacterium]
MAFCSGCGTTIADGTTMCAACSAKAPAATAAGTPNDNLTGALAYIPIVALIFLLIEPYNKNKFVRFHAFQCLFLAVAWIATWFILMVIPIIGWILLPIVGLGFFILLIVLFIKAYQGNMFRLPFIGDLA